MTNTGRQRLRHDVERLINVERIDEMVKNLWSISSISPSLMLAPPVARSTKTENSELLSAVYIPRLS